MLVPACFPLRNLPFLETECSPSRAFATPKFALTKLGSRSFLRIGLFAVLCALPVPLFEAMTWPALRSRLFAAQPKLISPNCETPSSR